ncbi:HlyD family secretion protein (plasmid) [Agrobacterium radiobacter]|uniref:Putative HlyD family secretion protein n=1 Tax=Agrobacterium tumefaciens str. B6 TaxID=1183423 RepID=A0A822VDK8_AGRTU|nr:HlyD family efflux transporter periplasmic adaptor subunit [Agrobacterium tumefaciens]MQB27851.1 HlyD family efflux transporter periplasmic adaptor subunit [Agrobacterium tumefaciens]NTA08375.1 HlyD family efflux transporter periplasmic adaptor subunit [Agrobacterium tumefaciens]NTB16197.1 HlyD family efflux transporter periplasmic adaptor subunit [Agrobacterium tumefaciens]CVI25232.1 putative HlyD family secretion protein [Agrobacterium tumefaciens str. B6]
MAFQKRKWLTAGAVVVIGGAAFYAWQQTNNASLPDGIASGNGRLEAVEIDISAKTAGRLKDILAGEGEFVKTGQTLAQMDTIQLVAKKRQAEAEARRAEIGIDTAQSLVAQREADRRAAEAVIEQREAELDAAKRKLTRSEQLARGNTISQQTLDDDRAIERGAQAAVGAAQASLAASEAAINSAKAQVVDAEASVAAAKAAIESIEADIADSTLKAPRDGRVQYRVAQPGEVLSSGGRVVNMIDVSDVYMTFFLPTRQAGRVAMGTEVRLVLDAAPEVVIPATVSFVADVAQFTPKTVETEEERQKLTFRIRARIAPELLQKYIQQVKTGLPGMAYVRLDPETAWPAFLEANLVR